MFSPRSTSLILSLLLTSCLLAACGFKLRGTQPIPATAQELTLIRAKDTPVQFNQALTQAFQTAGIRFKEAAPYQLEILDVSASRRSITLDSRANVDEYELNFLVTFELRDGNGKSIAGPINTRSQRIYDYDADAATASFSLEQEIRQEMWQSLAQRILRQYIARTRQEP